jgi:hypothetical protein
LFREVLADKFVEKVALIVESEVWAKSQLILSKVMTED